MDTKKMILGDVVLSGADDAMLSEDGDLILSGFTSGTPSVNLLHVPMQKYANLLRNLVPHSFTYVNLTDESSSVDMRSGSVS